ncbi:MAG: DUF5335 family protein [Bacteroidales bacterium]
MPTREIPREQWRSFLDEFSRKHRGEKATVEVLDRERGDQTEATNMTFVGISADQKAGENVIAVMVGDQPGRHEERLINKPAHVRVEEGRQPAIEIEPSDGPKTLLRFEKG